MSSEDQIVARVLAGETIAFRKLVEQYHQPVFRFAHSLISDRHDAEDIAQEVFLAAFKNLASFNNTKASLLTWLFTITRNRCVNYLKRKRPVVDEKTFASNQSAIGRDTSAKEATRNEFWIQLDEALNALPLEQKTAFVLAEIEELPYADIALIERTTLGTVKSRIHRAKQRLRDLMAPTLGEH